MASLTGKLKLDLEISQYEWKLRWINSQIEIFDKNDGESDQERTLCLKIEKDSCEKYIRDYKELREEIVKELVKNKIIRYI